MNTFRLGEIFSGNNVPDDVNVRNNSTGYDTLKLPDGSTLFSPSHYWNIASMQQTVMRETGAPYFSYRDLIYPFRLTPRPDLETFWRGVAASTNKVQHVHPDTLAHTLVAAGTIHTMGFMCEQARNVKPSFGKFPSVRSIEYNVTNSDGLVEVCPKPAQILRGNQFKSVSSSGGWTYGENDMSHHKIAWTIRGNSVNNEIVFDLAVGPKRQLIIENMQSWQLCGRANVYLGNGEQNKIGALHSFHKPLPFTLPTFQTIEIPPASQIGSKVVNGVERIQVRISYIPVDNHHNKNLRQMLMLYSLSTC